MRSSRRSLFRGCIWWPRRSAIWATSRCARWKRWPGPIVIACEDTRITRRLTERFGIHATLWQYHEHNAAQARPQILAEACARRVDRAGVGRRHAADFRSRLQAGARGLRRRPQRRGAAGPVLGADRAGGRGFADRPVLLRRIFAVEAGRAAGAARRACAHRRHAGAVRIRQPGAGGACRISPRRWASARPRSAANSPSCTRKSAARRSPSWRRSAEALETRGEFVLVIGPPPADAQAMSAADLDAIAARNLAANQCQGRGGAGGRTDRPAAARNLCARPRTVETERGRWRRLNPRRRPRRSGSRHSAPASRPKPAPPLF